MSDLNLNIHNEVGGCIKHIIMGMHQANLLLAKRHLSQKFYLIVSKDSNFSACVGSSLIQVKDLKYNISKNQSMQLKHQPQVPL